MSAWSLLFREIGEKQGWNDTTKLELCMEYIDNQGSDDAFADFLLQKCAPAEEPTCPQCGAAEIRPDWVNINDSSVDMLRDICVACGYTFLVEGD